MSAYFIPLWVLFLILSKMFQLIHYASTWSTNGSNYIREIFLIEQVIKYMQFIVVKLDAEEINTDTAWGFFVLFKVR